MSTPDAERVVFDTADPDVHAYPLLTASVVPRPIAWVTSRSADGVGNLAPHSFYTVACANPPIVQFTSVGVKDTLRNVLETGEFVISLAGAAMAEAINASSARYGADVDEAGALGVRLEPSAIVGVPRVADSPVSIECRLHSILELGDSTLVLGDVVAVTVRREALADDGLPDFAALQPLSRLGRNEWGGPPPLFALDRPHLPS